jgi:hypothetical protein
VKNDITPSPRTAKLGLVGRYTDGNASDGSDTLLERQSPAAKRSDYQGAIYSSYLQGSCRPGTGSSGQIDRCSQEPETEPIVQPTPWPLDYDGEEEEDTDLQELKFRKDVILDELCKELRDD